jgi:hydroxyacylglutathione hydrolase
MKNPIIFLIVGGLLALPLLGALPPQRSSVSIHPINLGVSNAFLLRGEKNILIDTGPPDKEKVMAKQLHKLGLDFADISLIILTHGHGDHAGGTAYYQENYQIPVLAGEGDAGMMRAGQNHPLKPMSAWGRLLQNMVDFPFPPFEPDIYLAGVWDLSEYGINGKVVPLPGHTEGSLAVLLDSGEAFVGDLLRGGHGRQKTSEAALFPCGPQRGRRAIEGFAGSGLPYLLPGALGALDGGGDTARLSVFVATAGPVYRF